MLVLAVGWLVGWLSLTSNEYSKYGKYMAGGAAFLDNFMFWRDSGYFDSKPDTKPLLHLWSLGVEEQFYLLWPLLIGLSYRFFQRATPVLWACLVASLAYSLWTTPHDTIGAFYSPLTRAWELMAGAAWMMHESSHALHHKTSLKRWSGWLFVAGVVVLVLGLVSIRPNDAFPGAWAALPVIAAILILASCSNSGWHQTILQQPALIHMGSISYPLYLWHWPLLSFARVLDGHTPSAAKRAFLLLAAWLLAILTHRFIEYPIRFGKTARSRTVMLVLGMGVLFGLGHWVSWGHGMKWRFNDLLEADPSTMVVGADRGLLLHHCGLSEEEEAHLKDCFAQNKKTPSHFMITGDSKAEALFYGLARESPENINWTLIGGTYFITNSSQDRRVLQRALSDPQMQVVVISNALRGLTPLEEDTGRILNPPTEKQIEQWIDQFEQETRAWRQTGRHLVYVIDNPTLPDPNDCISGETTHIPVVKSLLYRSANPRCNQHYSDHLKWTAAYYDFARRLQQRLPDILVYNPVPLLCNSQTDLCPMSIHGQFLYSYGDHISDTASSIIAKDLLMKIKARFRLDS
jgi:peptidoglycan/LPS O-acetylase OafA/YrhL